MEIEESASLGDDSCTASEVVCSGMDEREGPGDKSGLVGGVMVTEASSLSGRVEEE